MYDVVEHEDECCCAGEVLKREWKILRDSMRQALKRSNTGATTKSGLPCKKWRFQSRMAFVLPYMTIRRNPRFDKSRVKADETEAASDQECEAEAWEPAHQPGEHDSLELFFASVCQSTKRLPRKHQAAVKRHVLDALLRAEADWEADQTDSKAELNKDFQ
uniref:BESS domain-containing protein n=1 Tax=Heliothis virescens TaxID=7102 RepID=A0A2A4JMZ9_HELVI